MIKQCINTVYSKMSDTQKQWAWFVGLWCGGLTSVFVFLSMAMNFAYHLDLKKGRIMRPFFACNPNTYDYNH